MNYKPLKDIDPSWSFSKLSLHVRREHTDLSTPCQPGTQTSISGAARGIRKKLIAHLGLTKEIIKGMHTCHLCACDSQQGGCQNVAHVYFGTASENRLDQTEGHFNHTPAAPGTYDQPYCPDCGYTSNAKLPHSKRMSVKRHIKRKSCNSPTPSKRKTHAAFAAKGERV